MRAAQTEFNKFDMEGDGTIKNMNNNTALLRLYFYIGWLDKVILLPLIKACFTPAIPEPTIRRLLCGQALQSMVKYMMGDAKY